MKLINQKAEYFPQAPGLEGIYKQIELCGRTCYKSEDKITDESAKPFVDRMIASKHTAMLEHGTVYLIFDCIRKEYLDYHGEEYCNNPYSKVNIDSNEYDSDVRTYYITTNLRVIIENNWIDDLKYISEPTKYHEKRYTFRLTTSRSISHELVRHRTFSFAQESQRYCNYSKDKYGHEITFIKPSWYDETKIPVFKNSQTVIEANMYQQDEVSQIFEKSLRDAEIYYLDLLNSGLKPEEARVVLPNATKTEICMTGFRSDWEHFFNLRLYEETGKVHPDMKQLTTLMKEECNKAGIIFINKK